MADSSDTSHAADAVEKVFPPFDATTFASQLFWLTVSFIVLYVILSRWLLPKIGGMIEQRRDTIADDLDEAARLQREAEAAGIAYEQALKDARARAHTIAAETRSEVDADIETATRKAEGEITERLGKAEARIATARANAEEGVREIAAQTAKEVVTHLTGLKPTIASVRSTVKSLAD